LVVHSNRVVSVGSDAEPPRAVAAGGRTGATTRCFNASWLVVHSNRVVSVGSDAEPPRAVAAGGGTGATTRCFDASWLVVNSDPIVNVDSDTEPPRAVAAGGRTVYRRRRNPANTSTIKVAGAGTPITSNALSYPSIASHWPVAQLRLAA
jgi:hypothetical protein